MLRAIMSAIGRAVRSAMSQVTAVFKSLLEIMYPGLFDVPPPPVAEVEQALDFDPFELAEERLADREEALADTLTYAADTLRLGSPAALPQSLGSFGHWLHGLGTNELERILTADPTYVYGHMFLQMPMSGLPSVDEVRPATRLIESPAVEWKSDPTIGSGSLMAHASADATAGWHFRPC